MGTKSDNWFACLLVVTQITAVLLAFALAYFL